MVRSLLLLVVLPACEVIVGFDDPQPLILDRLTVTGAQLAPAFDPEITSYTATLSYADTVTIVPHSPDPGAMIEIVDPKPNGAEHVLPVESGSNVFTIEITTQHVTATYRVTVSVPGAKLKPPQGRQLAGKPVSMKVADFTNTGRSDLAVCTSNGIQLFEGVLPFDTPVTTAPAPCVDFAIGDIDNEQGPDLVGVNNSGVATVLTNTGLAYGFDPPNTIGGDLHYISVALGDINGDGDLDVMVGDDENGPPSGGTQRWMFGDGNGGFGSVVASLPAGANPRQTLLGNFNSTAGLDAVVVDGRGSAITLLSGNGAGVFVNGGAASTFVAGETPLPRSLIAIELDEIPVPDYVIAHENRNEVQIITNFAGSETMLANVVRTTLPTDMNPRSVSEGDLDGDGNVDLLVACHDSNNVMVFYGDGQGGFAPMRYAVPDGTPAALAVADFDADGLADLAVVTDGPATNSLLIYFQEAK